MSNEKKEYCKRLLIRILKGPILGANPTVSEMIAPESLKVREGMLTGCWWNNHTENKRLEV